MIKTSLLGRTARVALNCDVCVGEIVVVVGRLGDLPPGSLLITILDREDGRLRTFEMERVIILGEVSR